MKEQLFHLVKHRATWLAALATLLFCAMDFSGRVYIHANRADKAESKRQEMLVALPLYTSAQTQALIVSFEKYDAAKREALAAQNALSQTAQLKKPEIPNIDSQQGALKDVYTESAKLSLVAIINPGNPFALIASRSLTDDSFTFLQLKRGDKVDSFEVIHIGTTSLQLRRGQQQIELLMYKKTPETKETSNNA